MQNRKVIALLLTAVLFVVFGASVYAADIDLDKTGSISVKFIDGKTGELVPDGILSMYKVADIVRGSDGSLSYAYTDGFASCGLVLGDLTNDKLPESLSAYAQQNKLSAAAQSVGENGVCQYSDLGLGLYLIVQTKAAEGYCAIDPFLVSVPIADPEGWDYDIDATPKMEALTATSTSSTTTTNSSSTTSSTTNPSTTTTTLNSNVQGDGDGNKLPQTGQLNWPIPVLAGVGIILFLFGWATVFSGKKESR